MGLGSSFLFLVTRRHCAGYADNATRLDILDYHVQPCELGSNKYQLLAECFA